MLNQLRECFEKPELFQILIEGLQRDLSLVVKIQDANTDFEKLPGQIQYWLSMKAELEFLKRSIEKQMKLTSVPRLIELVKKSNYVSSKLLDTALESMPEYSLLNDRLSMALLVIDMIQSSVTGMWFKRDALVNLTASKRRQMDAEKYEY
jgi:hypothetical protein